MVSLFVCLNLFSKLIILYLSMSGKFIENKNATPTR